MSDRRLPGIMGERIAREEFAPPPRPGPIGGPPRPFPVSSVAYAVAGAVLFVVALVLLPGLLTPPSRPGLDPTAPTAQPAQPSIPAQPSGAQAEARPGPIAVIAPAGTLAYDDHGAPISATLAYDAPNGAVLGDVAGRAVTAFLERWGVDWVRAEVEGAGIVWLRMGALAGNAVDLSVIPCGATCVLGPMTLPTATAAPYVAPAPVYVAPAPPQPVVATLEAPAESLAVAPPAPTVDMSQIPTAVPNEPTPCPIVMTGCHAPLVVAP